MKTKRLFGRCAVIALAVVLLIGSMALVGSAANVQKVKKTYEIAVAYDNSGSMYSPTDAWCNAKYAMEIFASMLDYGNGDKLSIHPMWRVTTDGSRPQYQSDAEARNVSPIFINTVQDIDLITKMYTPWASGTPFSSVENAYNQLKQSSADQKWLIVLTDGMFENMSLNDMQSALEKKASKDIKVQYLCIGSDYALQSKETKNFFAADVNNSNALENKLIEICNRIFQRNELKNRLNGQNLKLDISMSKLVVFVQGNESEILSLKDSSGNTVAVTMNSGQRTYSEVSVGDFYQQTPTPPNKNLAGQVVTFGACPAGEYTLEYKGPADKVRIFYEPDVDMQVELLNAEGVPEDVTDGEVMPGEYTFNVKVVDRVTGEDITKHELMGGNVDVSIDVKHPSAPNKTIKNGDKFIFEPGEGIEVDVVAKYLNDFTISSKDDPDIFPNKLKVPNLDLMFKLDAKVEQNGGWYQLSKHNSWAPIRVDLTLEGQPLTADQFAITALDIAVDGGDGSLAFQLEPLPDQSAYLVHIGKDGAGNYVKPAVDGYTMKFNALTIDEYGKELTASDEVDFSVRLTPIWLWWLIALLIIAVLVFIAGIPVKPTRIYVGSARADSEGPIKLRGGFEIPCTKSLGEVALSGGACAQVKGGWFKNSWLKNLFKSTSMAFYAVDIAQPPSNITNVKIDSVRCVTNSDGVLVDVNDKSSRFVITNDTPIEWVESYGRGTRKSSVTFHGKIYINKDQ